MKLGNYSLSGRHLLYVLLTVLLIGISGCGGGSSAPDTPSGAISGSGK